MPVVDSSFKAPWWLKGGHAQTLFAYLKKRPEVAYRRERVTTPDGDFVDWDWVDGEPDKPVLALFHGLEGGSQSHYARHLMLACQAQGWTGVVCHFRGCSGEMNHSLNTYHSGAWTEVDWMLKRLAVERPQQTRFAAGVSLGGNALTRWAGTLGEAAKPVVSAAAAVSGPLSLGISSESIASGFNKIYTANFLRTMRKKAAAKAAQHPGQFDLSKVVNCQTLAQFDDHYTAPIHGYLSACDYYERASARPVIKDIRLPFLLLNAANDPFVPAHLFPKASEASQSVTLEQPASGGHVGFVTGPFPGQLDWLPQRLLSFFKSQQK
jgi:uncharacterized protein